MPVDPGTGTTAPSSSSRLHAPVPARFLSKIIGRPGQGTHTRGNWQSDRAVDIAVPVGTPIYAVEAGTIGERIGALDSGESALAGLRVNLEGASSNHYYAHLYSLVVHAGEQVQAGQLLGYSGTANGVAHLHYAAESIDPLDVLRGIATRVDTALGGPGATGSSSSSTAAGGAGCLPVLAAQVAAIAALVAGVVHFLA
jgi:murein DD-endopeptidase MepM/ murein hydrolase activator NlpD